VGTTWLHAESREARPAAAHARAAVIQDRFDIDRRGAGPESDRLVAQAESVGTLRAVSQEGVRLVQGSGVRREGSSIATYDSA
jgi:hypothetical protein